MRFKTVSPVMYSWRDVEFTLDSLVRSVMILLSSVKGDDLQKIVSIFLKLQPSDGR